MIQPRLEKSGNVEMALHYRANSTVRFRSDLAVAASIPSRSALASRRPLRAPPALALGALHSLDLHSLALLCLALLAVSPLASARSLDNAPPAAVPPPPPPSPPSGGYDYTCLWKDVSKTNCSDKSIGPWGILTFIVLVVAAGLIICTPFFILYRQTQRGSQKLRICCCGRKYPEYTEVGATSAPSGKRRSGRGSRGGRGGGGGGGGGGGAGGGGGGAARGAGAARAGGTAQPRLFFAPPSPSSQPPPDSALRQVLSLPSSTGLPLQPGSPLPAPSPYTEQPGGLAERLRRPSSPSPCVPLPPPPASSLPIVADPASDRFHAEHSTVTRLLATVVTEPSFESAAASALVAELVDFAAHCRLDYAASLVGESAFVCPPSVGGECALGTDVLEDRQEDLECLAAAAPHLVSMLLAPEGDPDAPDIPTPRSYAEAIAGEYSSQWQTAMDAEMASWKSTGTYVDEVPPPGANIVSGMWIFRVKRPPGSPPVFKARYVARGFSQREGWHNTLRMTLAALGFGPSTADPSLFLRTDTSLPPFYVLVYIDDLVFATADFEALALVKSELQKRHTCTDLGELRSYLGLQITRDRARRTITLTQSHMVHQVLQRFGFTWSSAQATPLATGHSLSAPPLDESVEPCGPYPELVGYLIYLMTCTRPDLAYPLGFLARYVAPGRHRKVHMDAAKRVLRYLCSTSGMGLVLGGRGDVVLTSHSDASWVDDQATQRSSQGYTFSLGSGLVSWHSTHSSSVLGSSCEAEIYATAMAAQELRWLTFLLTDLGERPRSPLVLYVDNKAAIALCQEHKLEHRTKHIALCYFLA
ncbi:unnamed protein product [Closterium sp. NIES-54]